MTPDRVLTLIALIWFALALLYLAAAGVIPAGAAVLQDGDDTPMTCGTWTYYAPVVCHDLTFLPAIARRWG